MFIIDNTKINNFDIDEFPESPIKYAHPKLITNLDLLREFVGCAIFPSPVSGALARFDLSAKKSQHYAKYRLSTAIDVFIDADPFIAYSKILESKLFSGMGFYPNWKFKNIKGGWHLDIRKKPLMWFRDAGEYNYNTSNNFYKKLYKYLKI